MSLTPFLFFLKEKAMFDIPQFNYETNLCIYTFTSMPTCEWAAVCEGMTHRDQHAINWIKSHVSNSITCIIWSCM